jgi:putative transposase
MEQAMVAFRFWYNHVRPHQHLNGWWPAEAWLCISPYDSTPTSM